MEGPCTRLYNRWLILHVYGWMELPNASILAEDIFSYVPICLLGG